MNQREAVYAATQTVLAENNIKLEGAVLDVMTKEIRSSIVDIVTEGFASGQVEFKATESNQAKMSDPKELRKYVVGLVNNWHRKDTRLNGGSKYETKNPGSRAGAGDEELKTLKALYKQFKTVDTAKATIIQERIDARVQELKIEKAKELDIDISHLSPDLVSKLGLDE